MRVLRELPKTVLGEPCWPTFINEDSTGLFDWILRRYFCHCSIYFSFLNFSVSKHCRGMANSCGWLRLKVAVPTLHGSAWWKAHCYQTSAKLREFILLLQRIQQHSAHGIGRRRLPISLRRCWNQWLQLGWRHIWSMWPERSPGWWLHQFSRPRAPTRRWPPCSLLRIGRRCVSTALLSYEAIPFAENDKRAAHIQLQAFAGSTSDRECFRNNGESVGNFFCLLEVFSLQLDKSSRDLEAFAYYNSVCTDSTTKPKIVIELYSSQVQGFQLFIWLFAFCLLIRNVTQHNTHVLMCR